MLGLLMSEVKEMYAFVDDGGARSSHKEKRHRKLFEKPWAKR